MFQDNDELAQCCRKALSSRDQQAPSNQLPNTQGCRLAVVSGNQPGANTDCWRTRLQVAVTQNGTRQEEGVLSCARAGGLSISLVMICFRMSPQSAVYIVRELGTFVQQADTAKLGYVYQEEAYGVAVCQPLTKSNREGTNPHDVGC